MAEINSGLLDDDLQAVMGKDRCKNEWHHPSKKNPQPIKSTPVKKNDPMEAHSEEENWMDKLKAMVKGIITPALLCLFFFWCQQTGQMADKTAVSAMFVCVGVVFFRVGRAAK